MSTDPGASTSYTYSLTSPAWTDPSGSFTATLDAFDRQVALTDPIHGSSSFSWSYRADGQPASVAAPNGNTTTYGYDDAGAETSRTTTGTGGIARAAYAWTRNQAGQILTEASTISGDPANGTAAYGYDQLGRLAGYAPPTGDPVAYGWDEVPNRTSVRVGTDPAVTTSYDAANRPTADSAGGSYAHDPDGRMTERPGQTLDHDDLGRLTSVYDTSTLETTAYTYDALDRLLTVDDGTDVTRFRYVVRTTSVAETVDHATGSVIRSIAVDWTGERLVDWTGTNSNQRFYGSNAHHDVTWTADDTGAVTATLRYDPWGTTLSTSGSSLPDFRFQGSWFDATTDLSWLVTRWYAPALGRFVSQDSLLGEPSDPPSRHPYAYAEGEPVGRWDPDGTTEVFINWDPYRAMKHNDASFQKTRGGWRLDAKADAFPYDWANIRVRANSRTHRLSQDYKGWRLRVSVSDLLVTRDLSVWAGGSGAEVSISADVYRMTSAGWRWVSGRELYSQAAGLGGALWYSATVDWAGPFSHAGTWNTKFQQIYSQCGGGAVPTCMTWPKRVLHSGDRIRVVLSFYLRVASYGAASASGRISVEGVRARLERL